MKRWLCAIFLLAAAAPGGADVPPPGDRIFSDGFEPPTDFLVSIVNDGGGTVTSIPSGIDCGASCSAPFPAGSTVTLQARTQNASGYNFTGWTGDCSGSFRDCTLDVGADRSVTANFAASPYNLVFVSSASFADNLGSASAYDAQCNALASAAGINNANGDAYVAWVSSFTSAAIARLGSARGWVRVDGAPFTDQPSSLAANQVFNPIDRDEFGAEAASQPILTGTLASGNIGAGSCIGWTTTTGQHNAGDSSGGPIAWTTLGYASCAVAARVYCFMHTRSAELAPQPTQGRRIWVTAAHYAPNPSTTPDAACSASLPEGVASAQALVATSTSAAADALDADATYVRIDGQIVGTGAAIAATQLRTGIWQTETGAYVSSGAVWTGDSADLTAPGTLDGTCMDWTSTSGTGSYGLASVDDARWWSSSAHSCADVSTRLVCVEQ